MAAQKHDDSLEKIAAEVRGCPLCKLARTRKNAVPGEGQLSAKIMFIGEAPGHSEDKEGRPFVGAAGRILDDLLKKAGIERSQVFITNMVKCRPPNNRVPKEDELTACRPYLDRQIALIKPKVICILGRTAYSSLLGGSSITASRGKIVETEAYGYSDDLASHAYVGPTGRNKIMFGDVGKAYVYFTYGNHFCLNVSARRSKVEAGAILIRGIEPVEGIELMRQFRPVDDIYSLTSGPGKLTQALNITSLLNGIDMTNSESEVYIEFGKRPKRIVTTPRIGITRALDKEWRFVDPSSPFISRKFQSKPSSSL